MPYLLQHPPAHLRRHEAGNAMRRLNCVRQSTTPDLRVHVATTKRAYSAGETIEGVVTLSISQVRPSSAKAPRSWHVTRIPGAVGPCRRVSVLSSFRRGWSEVSRTKHGKDREQILPARPQDRSACPSRWVRGRWRGAVRPVRRCSSAGSSANERAATRSGGAGRSILRNRTTTTLAGGLRCPACRPVPRTPIPQDHLRDRRRAPPPVV